MRIGVLPAVGAGLASLARTGQLERLFVHLSAYADAGDVRYFSLMTGRKERALWARFARQSESDLVLSGAFRVPSANLALPFLAPSLWASCDVFRCLNLLATLPALTAWAVWGIPFVMSYGADYEAIARIRRRPAWKWRFLAHVAVRRAAVVLVSNPALANRLRQRHPGAQIAEHPNWVDTQRFAPSNGTRAPRTHPHVYYVGRLVAEKNLLMAAAVVRAVGADFVCVGDGPFAAALHEAGATLRGTVPWEQLPAVFHDADAFLLPSLTEGQPKALLEAMACAVPCVVSNRVGVIVPFVTGMVFDVERPTTLQDALTLVLHKRAFAADLGDAAREDVVARFDRRAVLAREVALVCEAAR